MQQKQQPCSCSHVHGKYMVLLRRYKLLADELQQHAGYDGRAGCNLQQQQ